MQHVFEETKLKLAVRVTRGKWKKPSAVFKILKDGKAEKPLKAKVKGSEASVELDLWKVDDDKEYYTIQYRVEADGKTYFGTEDYRVWPQTVEFKTLDKDDKKYPWCQFRISQDTPEHTKEFRTGAGGEFIHHLTAAAPVSVEMISPYVLDSWNQETGRKREAKVSRKPWRAEILKIDAASGAVKRTSGKSSVSNGGDYKAYVNGDGRYFSFKVQPELDDTRGEDARLGKEDDEIFVKVTFGLESDRDDPVPKLTGDAGITEEEAGKVFKFTEKLGPKGAPPTKFKIDFGLGGGDTCEVGVGTTEACEDFKIKFTNWRKVEYELWQPSADGDERLTDYTNWKGPTEVGLSGDTEGYMKETLDKVFVEFTEKEGSGGFYEKTDLDGDGEHNVFDGEYFEKDAGKKLVALDFDHAKKVLDGKAQYMTDQKTCSMIWLDYLADAAFWRQTWTEVTEGGTAAPTTRSLRIFKKVIAEKDENNAKLADLGDVAIKRFKWKATHFSEDFVAWTEITDAEHPGYAHRNWTSLNSDAAINAHFEFVNWKKVKIKFPTGNSSYPAVCLPLDQNCFTTEDAEGKAFWIKIKIYISGVAATFGTNGAALRGTIWMNTFAGDVHPVGMGRTILHELGHNMGQAYASKTAVGPAWGRPDNKGIPGIPYPDAVPTGKMYAEHGHTGNHCADGLSATSKAKDPFDYACFEEKKCIMYGSGDMSAAPKFDFCDDCKIFIKGEDVSNIRKNWRS